MTKRERVAAAISHRQPDKIPVDIGATGQTGLSASMIYQLRKTLGLKHEPDRIAEIYQLLGELDHQLRD